MINISITSIFEESKIDVLHSLQKLRFYSGFSESLNLCTQADIKIISEQGFGGKHGLFSNSPPLWWEIINHMSNLLPTTTLRPSVYLDRL